MCGRGLSSVLIVFVILRCANLLDISSNVGIYLCSLSPLLVCVVPLLVCVIVLDLPALPADMPLVVGTVSPIEDDVPPTFSTR